MAQIMKKGFQLTPNQLLYQQKRYRGKINLKKPRIFYMKAVMNQVLTPFFINPKEGKTAQELCWNLNPPMKYELGPYEKIIMKDARNWFDKSKMIACVHVNSITSEEFFPVEVALRKNNMYFKRYGPKIVRAMLEDSPYTALEPLITANTGFIFSPDIAVAALEKVLKKCKQIYILAGVLENCILKHDNFLKYGQMDKTTAQLCLVQVLQNAGGLNLNRQLTHHQTTLVSRLEQIGTRKKEASEQNEQSVPV